jgi:hypothetical protein
MSDEARLLGMHGLQVHGMPRHSCARTKKAGIMLIGGERIWCTLGLHATSLLPFEHSVTAVAHHHMPRHAQAGAYHPRMSGCLAEG